VGRRMAEFAGTGTLDKGLEHAVMGESRLTLVEGETGGLSYRGYSIDELVGHASYEAVVHLLLHGTPPTAADVTRLETDLHKLRTLPAGARGVLQSLPVGLPPLEALRTLISSLGDGRSFPYPPTREQGLALVAQVPVLLAGYVRRSQHAAPLDPLGGLGHVAQYLFLLTGRRSEPRQVRALEAYFILLADHGMNASTFALRVVLSTQSDLISGATAAVAALKGPLHGGAPSKVSDMLDSVGTPENAEAWVSAALARKERLMGFGHRAYKTEDPRAKILKRIAREAADPERLRLAEAVETAAVAALERAKPGLRLYTNVEFYGALVLEAAGLPRDLFTPTFAVARTAGWAAHAIEQAADNRLIRPEVAYIGETPGHRWPVG
jgi:citrate synthase